MISRRPRCRILCIESDDSREGVTAFFEKREPQFRGR
jgi:enoyl-CoA hydratase/carnithine racemase